MLPKQYSESGNLVAIDGSFIDVVLSIHRADYRKGAEKAEVHMGFDVNRSIPGKLFPTDGKGGERPFVSQILFIWLEAICSYRALVAFVATRLMLNTAWRKH